MNTLLAFVRGSLLALLAVACSLDQTGAASVDGGTGGGDASVLGGFGGGAIFDVTTGQLETL